MLVVRRNQLDRLRVPAQHRFEEETAAHLAEFYPVDVELLGEDGLLAVIREGQREAMAHGFALAGDVRRFITLRMVLGSFFLRDPLLPWAGRIMAEGRGKPGTIDRLVEEAADHLERVSGEDGQYALRAVLRMTALSLEEMMGTGEEEGDATLALLRTIWPQKFRILQPERRVAFLWGAATAAVADGLETPGPVRFYTLMTFLLGAGFAADPALPWARAALSSAPAGNEAAARALYDAGQATVARLRIVLPAGTG